MQLAHHISDQASTLLRQQSKLLIVEDEVLFARAVLRRLQKAGYECEHVESLQDARNIFKQFSPDIVLLDMRLPDGNGLDLLADLVSKNVAVIVMTAHGEISDAVYAIKQGAIDYLKKPIDLEELLLSVQKAETSAIQSNSLDYSRQRNAHAIDGVELLGESPAMQSVKAQIQRIAQLVAVDTVPPTVLISGETGTGKDVAARLLHLSCQNKGQNNDKPFVHIDCASLPPDLMESELFGHERGAFTGAVNAHKGKVEQAGEGTLFLDEIAELTPLIQGKLLRILEAREYSPVGSAQVKKSSARFITATNVDLQERVAAGEFREDLFYRLNVAAINLPPLRERPGDIPRLVDFLLRKINRDLHKNIRRVSGEAIASLNSYAWPGNVRQLENTLMKAAVMERGDTLSIDRLPPEISRAQEKPAPALPPSPTNDLRSLRELEKDHIVRVLERTGWHKGKACEILDISRPKLERRIHEFNLIPPGHPNDE